MPGDRAPAGPRPTRRDLAALLRGAEPGFRRLLTTRLTSQWADGVFQASLAGAVLFNPERAAAAQQLATALAVLLLPYSLVGPFAGILLDRWSRQRILVTADLLRTALVLAVAGEVAAGIGGYALYPTALLTISISRFVNAGLSAALPSVVADPGRFVTANALSTTLGTVAGTVGAAVAIALRSPLGEGDHAYAVVAASAALGYAASAAAAAGFDQAALGPTAAQRVGRESVRVVAAGLRDGVRHVRERRQAAAALTAMTGHRLLYGMTTVIAVLLYRNYFHTDGFFRAGLTGLSQLVAAGAIGALLASIATPPVTTRIGTRAFLLWLLVGSAVLEVSLGLPFRMPALLAAGCTLGFAAQGIKIAVDTTCQREVDDEYRGRVFSVYDTLFNVMYVVAAAIGIVALPDDGHAPGMIIAVGVGYLVIAALAARAGRPGRSSSASTGA